MHFQQMVEIKKRQSPLLRTRIHTRTGKGRLGNDGGKYDICSRFFCNFIRGTD